MIYKDKYISEKDIETLLNLLESVADEPTSTVIGLDLYVVGWDEGIKSFSYDCLYNLGLRNG